MLSAPPVSEPLVAADAQRPTYRVEGWGDWPKNRSAARYSGALLPKSAATSESVLYSRMRVWVSMTLESPRISSAPKLRNAEAIGLSETETLTMSLTARPGMGILRQGESVVIETGADCRDSIGNSIADARRKRMSRS